MDTDSGRADTDATRLLKEAFLPYAPAGVARDWLGEEVTGARGTAGRGAPQRAFRSHPHEAGGTDGHAGDEPGHEPGHDAPRDIADCTGENLTELDPAQRRRLAGYLAEQFADDAPLWDRALRLLARSGLRLADIPAAARRKTPLRRHGPWLSREQRRQVDRWRTDLLSDVDASLASRWIADGVRIRDYFSPRQTIDNARAMFDVARREHLVDLVFRVTNPDVLRYLAETFPDEAILSDLLQNPALPADALPTVLDRYRRASPISVIPPAQPIAAVLRVEGLTGVRDRGLWHEDDLFGRPGMRSPNMVADILRCLPEQFDELDHDRQQSLVRFLHDVEDDEPGSVPPAVLATLLRLDPARVPDARRFLLREGLVSRVIKDESSYDIASAMVHGWYATCHDLRPAHGDEVGFLARLLTERYGDDEFAWNAFMAEFPSWNGPVRDLLDAIDAVHP
ncbi:hypothetical protein GCM10009676_09890 [Prauserella halophila]|uniref:Uncharacterized protein n=1 Tax=Prauserella halophila TaxID=185641 RepID=A0ABN1W036_9PSEU|nr:hypothetical protein [Prauserella halophila]MCP2235345.1 hypothetical protein [Prauserella halophila]